MIARPKRSKASFHGGLGVCHCLKLGDGVFHSEHITHPVLRLTSVLVVNDGLGFSGIV